MDQVKIGSFIAQLRREKGWTQEELGEQVGVTNKTVSRWENGNYMPSIEMLTILGEKFGVSLNELLEGRRLETEEEFRAAADGQLATALMRPGERVRRWLERYGAFPGVVLVLCLMLGVSCYGMLQYRQAHPADVQVAGTYCYNISGDPWNTEYIVLLKQYGWQCNSGEYYRYRLLEALEYGSWQADGAMVTAVVGENSVQMLIKGDCLYVPDSTGGLTAYQKIADYGIFNSIQYEDFEE